MRTCDITKQIEAGPLSQIRDSRVFGQPKELCFSAALLRKTNSLMTKENKYEDTSHAQRTPTSVRVAWKALPRQSRSLTPSAVRSHVELISLEQC